MKKSKGELLHVFCLLIAYLILISIGCSKDKDDNGSLGDIITGVVLAPDGTTPIAGATVYIPESLKSATKANTVLAATACPEPSESYNTYTCSEADGSFRLNISTVTENSFTVRITKGSFVKDISVNRNSSSSNLGNIALPDDPQQGAGYFAVITGAFDRMQDILAKLGMGEVYGNELDEGTETFDMYDGDYSLPPAYPAFLNIFNIDGATGEPMIYNYDMVFINCGNEFEHEILVDAGNKKSVIRDYVYEGGKLYVTDQSYDFVEQVFPEYIDFSGSDEITQTNPELMDEAEVGYNDITSDATILDNQLASWLGNVSCQGESCLINPTTVHIAGFWSGWAVINGAHPGKSSVVKIWVSGPVEWDDWVSGYSTGTKPLTVSFIHGDGKVIYTSYHTEEDSPSGDFWPQERILQYLVFE